RHTRSYGDWSSDVCSSDLERARREGLDRVGRITDGTVIDVQELISNGHAAQTMLIYKYEVAGVSYEASQDVTYLRQWINLQSCRSEERRVGKECRSRWWA